MGDGREGIITKKVGVAVDFSDASKKALKWGINNLLRQGDHLILVTVVRSSSSQHTTTTTSSTTTPPDVHLLESSGSPIIPYSEFSDATSMKNKYGVVPDAETLELVDTAAKEKQITPVMKIFWGDAREKLCESVDNIPLTCLVIGNRGLGPLKRVILGSVSNYVVNHASCPVTVVH